jgi:molybdenum cofactor cytidylyltransferase
MTVALLPAGGKSLRMGRPKLTLPLGGRTVIECVVNALQQAQVEEVLVVVAPHLPELATLAARVGANVLQLSEETADMRATVEQGLAWLEERFQPAPDADWLLCPADHPALDPGVIRHLIQSRQTGSSASILIPTFQGKRGHPTLISWRHVAGMRALPPGLGLNAYIRQHAAEIEEVPVPSPSVLWDLDTPEDYERIQKVMSDRP